MDHKPYETTDSPETLEAAIARVREAQRLYASYTQEQVDKIFLAAATAANQARIPLAKLAVEETGCFCFYERHIVSDQRVCFVVVGLRRSDAG